MHPPYGGDFGERPVLQPSHAGVLGERPMFRPQHSRQTRLRAVFQPEHAGEPGSPATSRLRDAAERSGSGHVSVGKRRRTSVPAGVVSGTPDSNSIRRRLCTGIRRIPRALHHVDPQTCPGPVVRRRFPTRTRRRPLAPRRFSIGMRLVARKSCRVCIGRRLVPRNPRRGRVPTSHGARGAARFPIRWRSPARATRCFSVRPHRARRDGVEHRPR